MSVNDFYASIVGVIDYCSPLNSTYNKVRMNRNYETMKQSKEGDEKKRENCPFMNLSFVQLNQKKFNKETCGILQHATSVKEHNKYGTLNRINAIMKFQPKIFSLLQNMSIWT